MEILIEPVTLPCNHTLCKARFESTVKKTNVCSPFCCHRIAFWTWHHMQRNSLVNMELYLLSSPGELRRDYEEERSKVEAEQQANQEKENKASEEYIQILLAEEEEEERRQTEKRHTEREVQQKSDEVLARRLNLNISNFCEESVSASPSDSKKSDPENNQYLSLNSQLGSASQFEAVEEDTKTSMSKENTEIEEGMPALSPQMCLEVQKQGAESSVDSPRPELYASGREWCLEGKVKIKQSSHEKGLCVISQEEPKARVPSFGEAAVKPYGETENGCTVSEMTQTLKNNPAVTENEESHLLTNKDITKIENQESLSEAVSDPCCSTKEEKCSLKLTQTKSKQVHFTSKLIDLERLHFERHKQEQDKLLALPNNIRNFIASEKDEYQLQAVSSPPGKLLNEQRKNAKERSFKRQTDLKHPGPRRASKNENWQTSKIQLKC
ncbi:hypothetical protein FD755_015981 [Muntiacus reevesi]|uniref:RING-type E3 ubiquitin transferase n=1 Tax=Muntiacus reevesi TaxID=9886 RepID=A0A5N3XDK9_MUNRE|nr:hypothetical protein FD755_015981 [Muntiacus reevesi]